MNDFVQKLITQAIEEAGTTEPGKVCLAIEDIRTRDNNNKISQVYARLAQKGIQKYSDVVKLVEEYKEGV